MRRSKLTRAQRDFGNSAGRHGFDSATASTRGDSATAFKAAGQTSSSSETVALTHVHETADYAKMSCVSRPVTVAIPTSNAGPEFARTLAAVRAQRLDSPIELLVCDSGSRDETVAIARGHGAPVIEIPRESFSHGGTRNLLVEHAAGEHVAFLTQDAVPVGERWLARLLAGFTLVADVGLVFGPYRPRPDASPSVARELHDWFGSFSANGSPTRRHAGARAAQRPAA